MKTADNRHLFEGALMGPYIFVALPVLFEEIHYHYYDAHAEFRRIAETRSWFKKLVRPGDDGLYTWEREEFEGASA